MSVYSEKSMSISPTTSFVCESTVNTNCDHRERSYSDVRVMFEQVVPNHEIINDRSIPYDLPANTETSTKAYASKQVRHLAHFRPRSKSESEYSHRASPVHKKKHMVPCKQLSGNHSPYMSHKSPLPSTSCGKMWIRPIPILHGQSDNPDVIPRKSNFVSKNRHSVESSSQESQADQILCDSPPPPTLPDDTRIRHGAYVLSTPKPDDVGKDVTMTAVAFPLLYSSPNSSFDSYQPQRKIIAFGESGKPITPIINFRQLSPSSYAGGTLLHSRH